MARLETLLFMLTDKKKPEEVLDEACRMALATGQTIHYGSNGTDGLVMHVTVQQAHEHLASQKVDGPILRVLKHGDGTVN